MLQGEEPYPENRYCVLQLFIRDLPEQVFTCRLLDVTNSALPPFVITTPRQKGRMRRMTCPLVDVNYELFIERLFSKAQLKRESCKSAF